MSGQATLLRQKLRKFWKQLPYIGRTLRLVWVAAPRWMLSWLLLLVLSGTLPAVAVILTREVVDSLVVALERSEAGVPDWNTIQPTLLLVAVMVGVILLTEVAKSFSGWIRSALAEAVKDYISDLIHQKSTEVDLGFYESPVYFDTLYRARFDAQTRPIALMENLGTLVQNGVTLIAMAGILIPYAWWLPLVLLVSTLPAFYVVLEHTMRQHRWRMRVTPLERRAEYYNWLLTDAQPAMELRLFNLASTFRSYFQSIRKRLRREQVALARAQGFAELAASGAALLATAAALVWMIWRAVQGAFSLGDLALFYQAFNGGQSLMRSLLRSIGQIYSNTLFLENLFDFLALERQIVDPVDPQPAPRLEDAIRFEGLAFRYPGSERYALDGFDLEVPAGQVVALVGANGAGKSTVIKLLCRFYDPDEGGIFIDGCDLREMTLEEVRQLITVLFQQPMQYSATAAKNIAMGDLQAAPDRAEIARAAEAAGAAAPIARLPEGYDTLLGKWLAGGTDLSVGEWQRLSLARAFLRQAQIIVLDEPTSAMDSWAETEWLSRFRELAAGRTAIIITHRFTTAMRADAIHVMEEGKIVESGTHHELLALQGRYATSWQAQIAEHEVLSP